MVASSKNLLLLRLLAFSVFMMISSLFVSVSTVLPPTALIYTYRLLYLGVSRPISAYNYCILYSTNTVAGHFICVYV